MALVAAGLSTAIKAKLDAKFTVSGATGASGARQDFCDCIAQAVIEYLLANNVVTTSTGVGTFT